MIMLIYAHYRHLRYTYVGRLEKKISKLKRNKLHERIQSLMDELFCHKTKESAALNPLVGTIAQNGNNIDFEAKVLQDVNKRLATELHATESALEAHDQKEETEKLCEKLSHLNVRNVNKRIKWRDAKIEKYKLQVEALEQEVDEKSEVIEQFEEECVSLHQKKEKGQVKSYCLLKKTETTEVGLNEIQSKYVQLESECNSKIKLLENEIEQLHVILKEKESITEQLSERLDEIDNKLLKTKEHKQLYPDNVS